MNSISISFVFPDIGHQPRTKKTAENIIQHLHFLKVRMMPVWEISGYPDGSLYTVGVIGNPIFFFFCRKNDRIVTWIRFD